MIGSRAAKGTQAPLTKDSFTLLTDDQNPLATGENARRHLKAHLVLLALTNSSLSVPDSFLLNNPNLRLLLDQDDTIRHLVSAGILQFALRDSAHGHARGLIRLRDDFETDGKLRDTVRALPDSALDFVQVNGVFRPWNLSEVGRNYATLCANALFSARTRDALGDRKTTFLQRLIEEEHDNRIERNLIYYGLEAPFSKAGLPLTPSDMAHLRLCVDAPYQSNLPALLGLNPAYDETSRASFELMRGVELQETEIDTAREMPDRLDAPHFVAGLAELPFEDIESFRDSAEFAAFIRAFAGCADPDVVEESFFELDVAIQATILARYPDLQSRSSILSKRKLVKYAHSYRKDGVGRFSDVVSFAVDAAGVTLPFGIGYLGSHLLDYVRGARNTPAAKRAPEDIAAHNRDMQRLKRYLEKKGMGDTMNLSEPLVETSSHQIETFIGQH